MKNLYLKGYLKSIAKSKEVPKMEQLLDHSIWAGVERGALGPLDICRSDTSASYCSYHLSQESFHSYFLQVSQCAQQARYQATLKLSLPGGQPT